jgi:uncharacterized protein YdhG (YjbR/CyaY superfamily)
MAKAVTGLVDAYIAKQPAASQPVLRAVQRIIRKLLPDAEETLSYQIPTYRQNGRYVVYFAGWKQHWSLYPVGEAVRKAVGPALESYEVSKGTVRFPLADPVPKRLVERIVRELRSAAEVRRRAGVVSSRRTARARRRRRTRR